MSTNADLKTPLQWLKDGYAVTQPSSPPAPPQLPADMARTLCVETIAAQASVAHGAWDAGLRLLSSATVTLEHPDAGTLARFGTRGASRTQRPKGAITGSVTAGKEQRRYKVALWFTAYSDRTRVEGRLAGSCSCRVWRALNDRFCEHLVAAALAALGYDKDAAPVPAAADLPPRPAPTHKWVPPRRTLEEHIAELGPDDLRALLVRASATSQDLRDLVLATPVRANAAVAPVITGVRDALAAERCYDGPVKAPPAIRAAIERLAAVSAPVRAAALSKVLDLIEQHLGRCPYHEEDDLTDAHGSTMAALGTAVDDGGWAVADLARFARAHVDGRDSDAATWLRSRSPQVRTALREHLSASLVVKDDALRAALREPAPAAVAAARTHQARIDNLCAAEREARSLLDAV